VLYILKPEKREEKFTKQGTCFHLSLSPCTDTVRSEDIPEKLTTTMKAAKKNTSPYVRVQTLLVDS
jgi:hypothetical protein